MCLQTENESIIQETNTDQVEIIDAGDSVYLGEFMSDLPKNRIVNKVVTGCGATTLALQNSVPYVIAVPYISLIMNKMLFAQENGIELQMVMGGVDEEDIRSFTGKKYICTYDSLGKLTKILLDKGELEHYSLLVDECHKLVDSGSFREDAVNTVLENYGKYKQFTFITATPVRDMYQLPKLKNIPKVKIKWNRILPVKVNHTRVGSNSLIKSLAGIAYDFLTGVHNEKNLHLFINSLSSIISIIKYLQDNDISASHNISIVCASNDRNRDTIRKHLKERYTINSVGHVKKVNFYTATAFEGSDIYDPNGVTYIATDGKLDYTKIDIMTTLPQIAGRIRDTKYKNEINLIYSRNIDQKYNVPNTEYESVVNEKLREAHESVEAFNSLKNDNDKKAFLVGHSENPYLTERGGDLIVNETAWYSQMNNYHIINNILWLNDFESASGVYNDILYYYTPQKISLHTVKKLAFKPKKRISFESACKLYFSAKKSKDHAVVADIENQYEIIKDAYDQLGEAKIKALEYSRSKIQDALVIKKAFISKQTAIVEMLNFNRNNSYTTVYVKERLSEIYRKVNIRKAVKLTDLNNWFDYKRTTLVIDGKQVNAVKIITVNVKVKT